MEQKKNGITYFMKVANRNGMLGLFVYGECSFFHFDNRWRCSVCMEQQVKLPLATLYGCCNVSALTQYSLFLEVSCRFWYHMMPRTTSTMMIMAMHIIQRKVLTPDIAGFSSSILSLGASKDAADGIMWDLSSSLFCWKRIFLCRLLTSGEGKEMTYLSTHSSLDGSG